MKKRVILAATLLVLVAVGSASAAAPNNLVSYYSFNSQTLVDEAAKYNQNVGVSASDLVMDDPGALLVPANPQGTNFVAGIGSKYDAAETGDYAISVKGQYQQYSSEALVFPTGDADLALGSNFTIEMWVHSGDSGTYSGATNATFMTASNYNIATTSGNIQSVNVTGGTGIGGVSWAPTGAWHHVALTFQDDGTYTYYWDGVGTASTYNPAGFGTTTALKIGVSGTARYTNGSADVYLDDIALWNTALDAGTIAAHAVAGGLDLTMGAPPVTHHLGDANEDGAVDLQDFGLLKENFGIVTGAVWGQGDFNGDGGIDLQDFGILKDHFGHTNGSIPVTAVPEPATMSLLALAGLGLLRKRTR